MTEYAIQQINKCGELEIEIIPQKDIQLESTQKLRIENALHNIEIEKEFTWIKLDVVEEELEKVICDADKLDYIVAFSSGLVAGVVDAFIVNKWDFTKAKNISNEEINQKVLEFAKENGYVGKRLSGAINKLESKFKLLGDSDYNGKDIGVSSKTHHLDDFCHHPTLIGLICCIIREFTKEASYFNSKGERHRVPLQVDKEGNLIGDTLEFKFFAGTVNWCLNVARNWQGHLYSDMAGSKSTAGTGMGIPGPIMSLLKELSALPMWEDKGWSEKLKEAYTKGIGKEKGQLDLGWLNDLFDGEVTNKFDMRTENAIKSELKRQSIPVKLNGMMLCAFYFVRQFVNEINQKRQLEKIDWKKFLFPKNSATLVRMLTVASGTFVVFDMLDAIGKSKLNRKEFVIRLNFVGIGIFAINVGAESFIIVKRNRLKLECEKLYKELLAVTNTQLYYKEANIWIQLAELKSAEERTERELEKGMIGKKSWWKRKG